MKILVLEDNEHDAMELEKIIRTVNEDSEVYLCREASEARRIALHNRISVFMVDIMLKHEEDGDASGIEYVDYIRSTETYKYAPVIFVTGFEEQKMYAYESLHCYKFLSKPYLVEEAVSVIGEAMELSDRYSDKSHSIVLKDSNTVMELKVSEIVYVTSSDRRFIIKTKDDLYVFYNRTISDVKKELTDYGFFQCSRTTMVNREFIKSVNLREKEIVLKNDYGNISFGRIYKKIITDEFSESILKK